MKKTSLILIAIFMISAFADYTQFYLLPKGKNLELVHFQEEEKLISYDSNTPYIRVKVPSFLFGKQNCYQLTDSLSIQYEYRWVRERNRKQKDYYIIFDNLSLNQQYSLSFTNPFGETWSNNIYLNQSETFTQSDLLEIWFSGKEKGFVTNDFDYTQVTYWIYRNDGLSPKEFWMKGQVDTTNTYVLETGGWQKTGQPIKYHTKPVNTFPFFKKDVKSFEKIFKKMEDKSLKKNYYMTLDIISNNQHQTYKVATYDNTYEFNAVWDIMNTSRFSNK